MSTTSATIRPEATKAASERLSLYRLATRGLPGEFLRYFVASGIAFAVDFGFLLLATEVFGLHYLLSATLGFILGIAVIYVISVRWVFEHRRLADRDAEKTIFLMVGVLGLGVNAVVIYSLTDLAGFHYGISKFGAAAVVFAFNFSVRKMMLFRHPQAQGN